MTISIRPVKYIVTGTEELLYMECRDLVKDRWVVSDGCGMVLDKALEWQWEPLPSNRTEDYIKATRFSFRGAKQQMKKYAKMSMVADKQKVG